MVDKGMHSVCQEGVATDCADKEKKQKGKNVWRQKK